MLDLAIIGAGPAGIAVGLAAQKHGLKFLLIDKGAICNTIYRFPQSMRFFSTADLLEFPGLPLSVEADKPRAYEVLNYFTRIALSLELPIKTYETVQSIKRESENFVLHGATTNFQAKNVVLATGTYDHPNRLDIPGEDLPHVSHYYDGPHRYASRNVVIVGGKNSAAEAALDLYRRGANVTMIHRSDSLRESSIKYWILPDLKNRFEEGAISYHWNAVVTKIEARRICLNKPSGEEWIAADDVLLLTGYQPDYAFLHDIGLQVSGEKRAPMHDPNTLETNIPGLYVAGVLTVGADPSKVFIENARHHGDMILNHIMKSGTA